MRYRLRTLVLLTAVGPPAIACVWFARWAMLFLALILAVLALCVIVSLALARFFAGLICSVMR